MILAGIDFGSVAIKIVFINQKSELLWFKIIPPIPGSVSAVSALLDEGLKCLSKSRVDLSGIASTGYGKHSFPDSDMAVDEITALCVSSNNLSGNRARTVINIGGQDIKLVKINGSGKVDDFKMNDKCASGTGRFFEMAAKMLGVSLEEFSAVENSSRAPAIINSTCTVFAESEITSLLYNKKFDKCAIIRGLNLAISRRISDFIKNMHIEEEVYLDGGAAQNKGLIVALEEELMCKIKTFSQPQLTSALGAATVLLQRKR